jgi:predicted dehydrogenase
MALGWALISTGKHADALIAPAIGLAEGTQFVAVYSREQERAEAFASKHGAQVAYTLLEALVADSRVDAVCIASPNFLHASYTKIAAQRGNTCSLRSLWPRVWTKQWRCYKHVDHMVCIWA